MRGIGWVEAAILNVAAALVDFVHRVGTLLLRLMIVFARAVQWIARRVRLGFTRWIAFVGRRIVLAWMLRWAIFLISHGVHSVR